MQTVDSLSGGVAHISAKSNPDCSLCVTAPQPQIPCANSPPMIPYQITQSGWHRSLSLLIVKPYASILCKRCPLLVVIHCSNCSSPAPTNGIEWCEELWHYFQWLLVNSPTRQPSVLIHVLFRERRCRNWPCVFAFLNRSSLIQSLHSEHFNLTSM